MNRKDFLNSWIRTGILGAFLLLTGFFATRGKISGSDDCPADFQCRACKKLSKCNLPESDKYRKYVKG